MSGNRTNRTMLHYWLLLSWCGSASLQYINVGPTQEALMGPLVSNFNARVPYYFTLQTQGEFNEDSDPIDNSNPYNQFYQRSEDMPADRKRRTIDDESKLWLTSVLEGNKQPNVEEKVPTPVLQLESATNNETDRETLSLRKRSFSPWGGKRAGGENVEQMWSWKRSARSREPSMPKRVRFTPWGGKRSGQVVYKSGHKVNRVMYSTTIPALTRILSDYSPSDYSTNINGYRFRPTLDKRHAIKILASHTQSGHPLEAMPFKNFLSSLPPMFKPGHPYVDMNLKKDGKRKVIFSQWGGKRTAPIIGPIWTPAPGDMKEATLDAILLIRNKNIDEVKEETMKAL